MRGTWTLASTLVLLGSSAPLGTQERESGSPRAIQIDAAIDRLPPIGAEGAFVERRGWVDDSAVLWLKEHVASGGLLTDEQWRRALLRSQAIRVREHWPVEEPIAVSVDAPAWLPVTEIRLYMEDRKLPVASAGGTSPHYCGNCKTSARTRWSYQEIQRFELGPQILAFHVVVERGQTRARRRDQTPAEPPPGILWNGTLEFSVQVVPRAEDVLPGVHDPALEAAVRMALEPRLFARNTLTLHASTEHIPELANTALSFEFEVLEGTEVRGTTALEALGQAQLHDCYAFDHSSWELPDDLDPPRWTIRVRGRAKGALRVWNATRYWDGELVIPLTDVPRY